MFTEGQELAKNTFKTFKFCDIIEEIRLHAVVTPKPCQDWKVAATRDAYNRRGLRVITVFLLQYKLPSDTTISANRTIQPLAVDRFERLS